MQYSWTAKQTSLVKDRARVDHSSLIFRNENHVASSKQNVEEEVLNDPP